MKLKKFLGFGIAFAAASLATVAVQAATYKAVSDVSTEGDDTVVTMTVNVSNATAVNGYAMKLTYDPDVLEPVASTTNDATGSVCYATTAVTDDSGVLVADLVDTDSNGENDAVAVGWAAAEAIDIDSENGTDVATVKFKVLEKKSTSVGVVMTAVASSAETVEDTTKVEAVAGTVSFGILGDVDGNKQVTATDASLVLQHELGTIVLDDQYLEYADVDGNGSITATDASLILQYELGTITAFPAETKD